MVLETTQNMTALNGSMQRNAFQHFTKQCEASHGRLQESLSQITCDLQAAFTVSKVLHAYICICTYAGWQVGLQLHLVMMAHTQDSFQKVHSYKAPYDDLHHSLEKSRHLQLRYCASASSSFA